jgi:hypothetical protein
MKICFDNLKLDHGRTSNFSGMSQSPIFVVCELQTRVKRETLLDDDTVSLSRDSSDEDDSVQLKLHELLAAWKLSFSIITSRFSPTIFETKSLF